MILVITGTVNLEQLLHKHYTGWWSNKCVKQCTGKDSVCSNKHKVCPKYLNIVLQLNPF